jgi:hypothetical protein
MGLQNNLPPNQEPIIEFAFTALMNLLYYGCDKNSCMKYLMFAMQHFSKSYSAQ